MRNISFAWTTPAFVTKNKTVTRREWSDAYAASFNAGERLMGYDRQPRFKGKPLGVLQLTRKPYKSAELPEEDWQGEGFEYLQGIGAKVNGQTPRQLWDYFVAMPEPLWIVRFEIVSLTDHGLELAAKLTAKAEPTDQGLLL